MEARPGVLSHWKNKRPAAAAAAAAMDTGEITLHKREIEEAMMLQTMWTPIAIERAK